MSYNRCKDIHKFGNKYLPSAYKMQVDFRSHFSGGKVHLIVREIRYVLHMTAHKPTVQHPQNKKDFSYTNKHLAF